MKKTIVIILIVCGLYDIPSACQIDPAQIPFAVADALIVPHPLFDSDELLEITLKFDISYYKKKKSDEEYLDAVLTYYSGTKDSVSKNIKVRARGEMRRSYCNFPPIMLNFGMKDSAEGKFAGIDKLKIVTHCRVGQEDCILKEYLAYRLYNILTENSFRVRLMRINYINTGKESKPLRQYGFAIEPVEILERRTGTTMVDLANPSRKYINRQNMDRCAIFNYMIGNTDWSVSNLHNILIMAMTEPDSENLGMVVPFDFDYSGFVFTNYAVPHESVPVESVRERYYMGFCRTELEFSSALKEFYDKKDEFFMAINDFPYLNLRAKKQCVSYLNEFFSGFDKRNSILYELLSQCKTP